MVKLKILLVCTGNICRSPLAEAIFRDYVISKKLAHRFELASAGTAHYHVGELPDLRSIAIAAKHAIKFTHVAQQISWEDLNYYDFVLVMDHRNYEDVLNLIQDKESKSRVMLLRSFDPKLKNATEYTVPDPYYGQEADFEDIFMICRRSIVGFISYLRQQELL